MDGILVVNKPQGMTSHDVVDVVRRLYGTRKVGHAGTLDPMATGVLVICLGQATRLAEYLSQHDKSYQAVVRLGQVTDTYDAEGRVTAESPGALPARETIEWALEPFRGMILQVPPAYSALKVQGQPLYRRARRGETVNPAPRPVVIRRLELTNWDAPLATLEVDCSPGTYIRSLAHDLGMALGCGAHLAGLVRTRSGHFTLNDAQPLEALEQEAEGRRWRRHLLPMQLALVDFDALELTEEEVARLAQGQEVAGPAARQSMVAAAYSPGGQFVAVVKFDATSGRWHPKKVFADRPLE